MTDLLLDGIGAFVSGRLGDPVRRDVRRVLVRDGRVAAIGGDEVRPGADCRVLDIAGQTVLPGLVDGHVHPVSGEWTPVIDSVGWVRQYLHGGTTTMVSAGELHLPGLDYGALTPELVTSLAVVNAITSANLRPSGARLHSGTVLAIPGMTEAHFDRLAEAGCRMVKFLFYPFDPAAPEEALRYRAWAHERGLRLKVHSGGVSRSGASQPLGFAALSVLAPDIVAHVSGGPIPVPRADLRPLVRETDSFLEICTSGNAAATRNLIAEIVEADRLDRLVVGTDTPGGTGVVPRGMLRNVAYLASVCGLDAATAIAAATGNTARAHGLDVGVLEVGAPADLLAGGAVVGSEGDDLVSTLERGDLPGLTHVVVGGEVLVEGRSDMTPPPRAVQNCC